MDAGSEKRGKDEHVTRAILHACTLFAAHLHLARAMLRARSIGAPMFVDLHQSSLPSMFPHLRWRAV
jgi:hypothetical protein